MEWINQNKEWLFSGIGAVVLGGVFSFFKKKKDNSGKANQSIESGDNSQNYQSGNDMTINEKRNSHER